MPIFSPEKLAVWTGGHWTRVPDVALTGFGQDSRVLAPGQVFVALKTPQRDGHAFLTAAQAAGAAAALVAQADETLALPQLVVSDPLAALHAIAREHRRAFPGPLIAITGSAGKTSTKNLIALLLGGEEEGVLATEGNLNNHLGVPLTLTRLDPARHRFAVVEAGISAPGEMRVLAGLIQPDLVVVTLLASAHLDALGSVERVAQEKAVLAAAVRPVGPTGTALAEGGVAMFHKSCTQFPAFCNLLVNQLVLEPSSVLRPATLPRHTIHFNVLQRPDETLVLVAYGPPPPHMFRLRRISDGMAHNAALAILAALRLGVTRELIQRRLATWQPAPLRGEIRREDGRLLYLDCYNANPASMADALATFMAVAPAHEPRLFVLGSMEELGAESEKCHRELGWSLRLRPEDTVFVIGAGAEAVRAGALDNGIAPEQVVIVTSLDPVRERLAEFHGAVFVKGSRRHRLEEVLILATEADVHAHAAH
jgi:UDP-N-acetylmuramoyl-tripeptide--D-alanyl-D-alanine ligase